MIPTLVDGSDRAPGTVVLAHGAGAGMTHAFLVNVASGLAAAGLRVVRFDFPYRTAQKRVPDPMPVLQATMRKVIADHAAGRFVLMGKSMGGRVATMVADAVGARGVVVFGYPFHPPGKPLQLRTAHLAELRTPTLILQGERDEFGTRDEVGGYALSPTVAVEWFEDGDHSLAPRRKSGFTPQQHLDRAIAQAAKFAHTALG